MLFLLVLNPGAGSQGLEVAKGLTSHQKAIHDEVPEFEEGFCRLSSGKCRACGGHFPRCNPHKPAL